MTGDLDVVRAIAEAHLPVDLRQQWLALLRPAVSLEPAADGDPVVARLGGVPALPPDVGWPAFDDWGPLSFVAELHLAALSAFDTGLRLPASGRLLFFWFDFFWFDGYGNDDAPVVVVDDPSTAAGSRVLLVPDDGIAPRSAPPGAHTYTERLLTGRQVVTEPSWDHPDTAAAFLGPGRDPVDLIVGEHPTLGTAFSDALSERRHQPFHQVGGFAQQIQGPVEYEVATARLPGLPSRTHVSSPRLPDGGRCSRSTPTVPRA